MKNFFNLVAVIVAGSLVATATLSLFVDWDRIGRDWEMFTERTSVEIISPAQGEEMVKDKDLVIVMTAKVTTSRDENMTCRLFLDDVQYPCVLEANKTTSLGMVNIYQPGVHTLLIEVDKLNGKTVSDLVTFTWKPNGGWSDEMLKAANVAGFETPKEFVNFMDNLASYGWSIATLLAILVAVYMYFASGNVFSSPRSTDATIQVGDVKATVVDKTGYYLGKGENNPANRNLADEAFQKAAGTISDRQIRKGTLVSNGFLSPGNDD